MLDAFTMPLLVDVLLVAAILVYFWRRRGSGFLRSLLGLFAYLAAIVVRRQPP